jgi:predicted dehydrogenase
VNSHRHGYGLVGCGRFGEFALQALESSNLVRPRRVADAQPKQAEALSANSGVPACSVDDLLSCPEVAIVHLATPPSTHHELASRALAAGKHVLIEKPFCLTLKDADDLLERARQAGRRLAVNHLLRYNPLVERLKSFLDLELLGLPLRAWVENYACDEQLPDQHWFWDASKSGGIFIEHATHFFDLHQWWFGAGQVVAAQGMSRGSKIDRVCSQAVHGQVLASGYHGFDQADRMDRAEHRVVCQRGEMRLFGWIPMRMEVEGLFENLPEGFTAIETFYAPDSQKYVARGEPGNCRFRGRLMATVELERSDLYQTQFRSLLEDQFTSPSPRLTPWDAREALRMAVKATELSRESSDSQLAQPGQA